MLQRPCEKEVREEEEREEEERGFRKRKRRKGLEHVLDAGIGVLDAVVGVVDADGDAVELLGLPDDLVSHRRRHPVQIS